MTAKRGAQLVEESVPGNRGHQLNHSDSFAAELETLGFDATLFAPLLMPAPSFLNLVPRRACYWDTAPNTFGFGDFQSVQSDSNAAFVRETDGAYRDSSGVWQIAGNNIIRPNHDDDGNFLGLLFESYRVNRCENYNANPDVALSGLTTGGGTETLSRVSDASSIQQAKLENLCTDGNLIRLDGGASGGYVQVQGITEASHSVISAWAKMIAGTGTLTFSGAGVPTPVAIGTTLERHVLAWNNATAGRALQISVAANSSCVFCLNQLESGFSVTSPMITLGATTTRSQDHIYWPVTNWAGNAFLSESAGSLVVQVTLVHSPSESSPTGGQSLQLLQNKKHNPLLELQFVPSYQRAIFWGAESDDTPFNVYVDISAWPTAQPCLVAARWNASLGVMQIGTKVAGTWTWSTEATTFAKFYIASDSMHVFTAHQAYHQSRTAIWNRTLTTQQIEALTQDAAN